MPYNNMLLSKRAAAETLSISLRRLENLIRNGQLEVIRIGRRNLISRYELNSIFIPRPRDYVEGDK